MRTLAIGDIHGCITALEAILRAVAPTKQDEVITLGDYVDRGPDSRAVLERLCELYDAGLLIPLRGNHDEMMLTARSGEERLMWMACGGRETLASYGHCDWDKAYDRVPARHWQFLEEDCGDWHETDTHIYAHGNIDADLAMDDQDTWTLRWKKLRGPVRHFSGKTLICGHTKQYGEPWVEENVIAIDTGAYDEDGWLTCLHVEEGRYWQANERGKVRERRLD